MVLLPIAAVVATSLEVGLDEFWQAVTADQAVAALKLTMIALFIVVAINAVFGTMIAWASVRDELPGKRFVNSLIDLPFASPTIVAGLDAARPLWRQRDPRDLRRLLHEGRGHHGPRSSSPCCSSSAWCSWCCSSSTPRWKRPPPWRPAVDDLPPGDRSDLDPGDQRRRCPRPSPARSVSSAR